MNTNRLLDRPHRWFILRRAGIVLFALALSSLAFCGEIHDAAKAGDLEKVRTLLLQNPNLVFSKCTNGLTALDYFHLVQSIIKTRLILRFGGLA